MQLVQKKSKWVLKICALCSSVLLTSNTLNAAPRAVYLNNSELFMIDDSRGVFTCGLISGTWLSGKLNSANQLFVSNREKVRDLKVQIKNASASKRRALELKLSSLSSKRKRGDAACKNGPNAGVGTPTPSATPSGLNFDAQGNVTARGKSVFGIPSTLSANITVGKSVAQLMCSGCHLDKTSRSFSSYRSATSGSPMFFTTSDLPDSDLANLTAYLNRFRLN